MLCLDKSFAFSAGPQIWISLSESLLRVLSAAVHSSVHGFRTGRNLVNFLCAFPLFFHLQPWYFSLPESTWWRFSFLAVVFSLLSFRAHLASMVLFSPWHFHTDQCVFYQGFCYSARQSGGSSKTRSCFLHLIALRVTFVDFHNYPAQELILFFKEWLHILSMGTAINSWAEKGNFLGKENSSGLISALFEISSKNRTSLVFITRELFIRRLHCDKILCPKWLG